MFQKSYKRKFECAPTQRNDKVFEVIFLLVTLLCSVCVVYLFGNIKLPPTISYYPLASMQNYHVVIYQLKSRKNRAGDVAQVVGCLYSMQEALGSTLSTVLTGYVQTHNYRLVIPPLGR